VRRWECSDTLERRLTTGASDAASSGAGRGGSSSADPRRVPNIRFSLVLSFSTNSTTESLRGCSVAGVMGEGGLVGSVE
jgi:hypothetical protein